MKRFILLLLIFCVSIADAQYIVKTVYFQPTDAPGIPWQVFDLLNRSKAFYRSEMERHGYGQKTYTLETDGGGHVGIHHIRGRHTTEHYRVDTHARVNSELPAHLTHPAHAQDNVLVIIVGGINILNTGNRAYAGYFLGNNAGGFAIIAGDIFTFEVLAHEIGHAFGLQHTTNPAAIMNAGSDVILDYEARWLDRHHFFNATHIRIGIPQFVKSLPLEAIENNSVRLKCVLASENGLYHVQVTRRRGGYIVGTAEAKGKSATVEVDIRRDEITNGDDLYIQVMDVHGNKLHHTLNNISLPDPLPEPEVVVEIQAPEEPEFVPVEVPEVAKPEEKPIEPEIVAVECPGCDPVDAEKLAVDPRNLLTTQWATLKQR